MELKQAQALAASGYSAGLEEVRAVLGAITAGGGVISTGAR